VPYSSSESKIETVANRRHGHYLNWMNICLPTRLLDRHRWLVFLLPFLVFMLVGSLEPSPGEPGGRAIGLSIPYSAYPWVYAAKIALTVAAMIAVLPGYRQFPLRVTVLAIVVGIVGGAVWIALWGIDFRYIHPALQRGGLGCIVGSGERSAFNPFDRANGLSHTAAWLFLVIRFFGLVAVVPVIEEVFLRGFVMPIAVDRQWWQVPFGKVNRLALILGTAVPMLMHPAELLAAAVWFSMITWLMLRTRNIWDCVAAHALTNLIMGIYVVTMGGDAWRMM
jgi:membrane protease YdiL (CAAX protease family)